MTYIRDINGGLVNSNRTEFVEYIKKRNERKKIKDIDQRINDIETAILNINEKLNIISEKIIGLSNK